VAKFSKFRLPDEVPEWRTFIFEIPEFPITQCIGYLEGSSRAKSHQLDAFSRFDRTPTCDRRTRTQGHVAYIALR